MRLGDFETEKRALSADELLAVIEAEEADSGDGQMRAGWMWFDNDKKRTLEEKVRRAAERYRAKFGRWPRICRVNSRAAPEGDFVCNKVQVVTVPNILPHHFWLGPLEEAA